MKQPLAQGTIAHQIRKTEEVFDETLGTRVVHYTCSCGLVAIGQQASAAHIHIAGTHRPSYETTNSQPHASERARERAAFVRGFLQGGKYERYEREVGESDDDVRDVAGNIFDKAHASNSRSPCFEIPRRLDRGLPSTRTEDFALYGPSQPPVDASRYWSADAVRSAVAHVQFKPPTIHRAQDHASNPVEFIADTKSGRVQPESNRIVGDIRKPVFVCECGRLFHANEDRMRCPLGGKRQPERHTLVGYETFARDVGATTLDPIGLADELKQWSEAIARGIVAGKIPDTAGPVAALASDLADMIRKHGGGGK
jgi:hypothetical protein